MITTRTKAWSYCLALLFLFAFAGRSFGQRKSTDVYVDKSGVMRWGTNNEEVRGFGINYTAMFAHAYRAAKRLNIPLEKAIDDDVYHFARLGFDAFRVHVWDTEISDTLGNLLENDHLRLFDYTLSRMKERGMKFVITPIAYWGNGWPEPDDATPGFSRKYGKDACLTNPDAIKAQERYLFQFVNHVNQYTGIAYKEDAAIIAFEVCNEPHHREAPEKVTQFINRMVKAIRNTGCKKPVFYNISHSINLENAYFDADIQGGTFQWYPTGLGAGHELGGNFLPNVDRYEIPFADNPKFKRIARFVYEFDAADVGRSYIYPAMARSFRQAGMQVATHFAYDPTYMADVNTEYGTHFMNLVYAPQKALSLMIAAEVFHEIPMYSDFGTYPENASFGNFRVSYESDLAEMISPTKFLYTNNTSSIPRAGAGLEKIAGYGSSPVVQYDGAGAYFLDKIEAGVWRLEVMPDAIWLHDPFERTSPKKKIAAVQWKAHSMTVKLSDLGPSFSIKGINDDNTSASHSEEGKLSVSPGTYLLVRDGITTRVKPDDKWKNIVLKEFVAPKSNLESTVVVHKPTAATEGVDYAITATIASPEEPESIQVFAWTGGFRPEVIDMKASGNNKYKAVIAGDKIKQGTIRYHIVVTTGGKSVTFPSGIQTHPRDWDFFDRNAYEAPVRRPDSPVMLFNTATDVNRLSRRWTRSSTVIPTFDPGRSELHVNVERLFIPDPENPNAAKLYDYSMRFFVGDRLFASREGLSDKSRVVVTGRALNGKPCKFQVALVSKTGTTYGAVVTLGVEKQDHSINLSDLKQVRLVTLPRPYPTFLSYYFEKKTSEPFDITAVETLQLSIGPGLSETEAQQANGVAIESIRIE